MYGIIVFPIDSNCKVQLESWNTERQVFHTCNFHSHHIHKGHI